MRCEIVVNLSFDLYRGGLNLSEICCRFVGAQKEAGVDAGFLAF
jgi:hypothetical protein